jgi:beta-lactamase regulating signal transducer with metallopeptidase domain
MSFPDFTFWSHLLATVGIEVCCLAALGFVAQRFLRPALWQRAVWQMTVICLLLLPASEWSGLGRGAAGIVFAQKRVVESAPASGFTSFKSEVPARPVEVKLNPPPAAAGPAVWWPGWVWLAGTVVIVGRMAAAQVLLLALRLRREKISTHSLRERVVSLAKRLGLRRKVSLLLMPKAISPMAFGILRPSIGLPPGFETKLSATEQEAVLAHELAHLAALDPLWFLLADCASALLWWHPLAWWARRSLHVSAELAADEATALVPEGPDALAKCLVALGKDMTAARGWGWVGINGGFRSNLGKRVERLTRMSGGASRPLVGWVGVAAKTAAAILIVPTVVLLFGSFQSAHAQKEDTWRDQFEESWRQSPAGVLLLARADHPSNVLPSGKAVQLDDYIVYVEKVHKDGTNLDHVRLLQLGRDGERKFKAKAPSGTLAPSPEYHQLTLTLYSASAWTYTNNHWAPCAGGELRLPINADAQPQTMLRVPPGMTARQMLALLSELEPPVPAPQPGPDPNVINRVEYIPPFAETGRDDEPATTVNQTKMQNAKLLYQMGKYDESEAILHQVLKDDPTNRSAPYYLDLVKQARMAATNLVQTTPGRPRILSKLQSITLDEVSYDLPLKDVLAKLRSESQKRDPEGIGINFMIINQSVDTSGQPAPTSSGALPRQDIGAEVTIRIFPSLANVRLMDVLDAIVMAADKPICYTVKDFAVVFSPKAVESAPLYSKTFRVDSKVFVQGLKKVYATNLNPGISTGMDDRLRRHEMVRSYFTAAGARMDEPGATVFFNDRLGEILVRSSLRDLEIIQRAIEMLNQPLPQVMITARFVELSQEDTRGLGFNWYPGNTLTNSGASGLQGGSTNLSGVFAAPNSSTSNDLITSGLRDTYGSAPLTGIMTDPQLRVAINAIEQRTGSDILTAPKVTTESGRQAHIGVTAGNEGVTLEVFAVVGPDGFSIATTAIPTIKTGSQTWQASASIKLWDGQTLVVGGVATNQPPGTGKMRMVFITPRIIDPAGNPAHSDDELSKRTGIPDQ